MVRGLPFHLLFRVGPESQWQIPFASPVLTEFKKDLTASDRGAGYRRHSHSSRSNVVDDGPSSRWSSPRARMRFAAAAQPLRGRRAAWTTEPARLRVELDFFGQIRFVQERLGNPNPPRIADLHNARPGGHRNYSVATPLNSGNFGRNGGAV